MRRWNCGRGIGICALALGLGILVAAIFLPAALKGGKEDEDHRLESTGIFAGDPALLILPEGIAEAYLS